VASKPRFVAGLLLGLLPALQASADVALIVNPQNPEGELSASDVKAIFRQEQQHWKSGGKIYLVLQEAGSPEKDLVLKRIYGLSDEELKQFWLGKLFRGEIASFPYVAPSNISAKRLVAKAARALAFVDASLVDGTVKVIRIDGKQPGDPGYLLAVPSK